MQTPNPQLDQAMIELRLIAQRLIRIETRQVKLLTFIGLNPSKDSDHHPGQTDGRKVVLYEGDTQ